MGGLIFMNAVLQIVITPLLNRVMGAEQLGGLLYITGLIAIVCPSVGQALNTSRLVVRRNYAVTNGDYDWILLVFGAIGSGVALWMVLLWQLESLCCLCLLYSGIMEMWNIVLT